MYDYLIVGSGLFGSTFAYRAKQAGKKCLVIEKREHLGGNVYCEERNGIHVHKYGAHIFHTSNKKVWEFVNSFVEFNRYTNSPVANYEGQLFNPRQREEALQQFLANCQEEVSGKEYQPKNLEEQALLLVGKDIYERLIKGYTEKQWGRKCTDLPSFIIKRLPVRLVFDNNYFNDRYQGIPIGGYNTLIEKLLNGVDTLTNTDFFADREYWERKADKIVYTGQLDEYFDYTLGKLNYRTVRFEHETIDTPNYQGNAVVNYTSADVPWTRIIEHKHFELFGNDVYSIPQTVISREYSTEWKDGMEPYYPVNDDKNNQLAEAYRNMAKAESNVVFGGRLAEYKYYDMAPVIDKVLSMDI